VAERSRRSAARPGVAAVDRAIALLGALEATAKPMTLADLARATRLYKSTILRLLVSLEDSRLVVRRSDQRYALGPFAWRLGSAFDATFDLKATVLPICQWLIDQGTESPSFHVRHDDETRICLCRIDSKHSTLDRVREGDLLPLRRGAPGRVLRVLARGLPLDDGTPLVYASYGERDPACAAVATGVFGADGGLVGALSLSGPLERFSAPAVKKMARPLLSAAARATRAFGGTWPTRHARILDA
jgi:DNA-binding IclR family transcriptional regulator